MTMQIKKALILFVLSAINMCCAGAEPAKDDAAAASGTQILVLNMRFANGLHQVTSARVVDSRVPLKMRVLTGAVVAYAVTDAADNPLAIGTIDDPRLLRGPMAPPGDPSPGHATVVLDSTEYILRVPYTKDLRFLKFLTAAPADTATREKISNEKARQVIDLQPYVSQ